MKKFIRAFAVAAVLCMPAFASATVIKFNGGADPFFNYSEVSFTSGSGEAGSGYTQMVALTGGLVAFNPYAAPQSSFIKAAPGLFTLKSLMVDGAWGTQTLTFVGLSNGATLYTQQFGVSNTPSLLSLNWAGINELRVLTGNDFVQNLALSGRGQHWVIDNITIDENVVAEPGSLALLGLGVVGLIASRKKFGASKQA